MKNMRTRRCSAYIFELRHVNDNMTLYILRRVISYIDANRFVAATKLMHV